MKKSYTLLITIVLITFFSVFSIFILETKSLRAENLTNQYLYIQAKNHKNFLKEYLNSIDLTNINDFEIEDDLFDIYAKIEKNVCQTQIMIILLSFELIFILSECRAIKYRKN